MDRVLLAFIKTVTRCCIAISAGALLYAILPDIDEGRAIVLAVSAFVIAVTLFYLELYLERKGIER